MKIEAREEKENEADGKAIETKEPSKQDVPSKAADNDESGDSLMYVHSFDSCM